MAKLRINGDSSGYVDLEVGSTGSNLTSTATTNTFNGNVGIGTSSPSQVLHVKDSSTNAYARITATTNTGIDFGQEPNGNGLINLRDSAALRVFTSGTERMRLKQSGGMTLSNITTTTDGMIFENSARVPGMANVQGSSGTGLIAAAQTIPTNTTTDIARSHWGGTVWVGYAGSGQQGIRKVDFGYARSPTVQYSAAWAGGATLTFTTSAYNLRVNHNSGSDMNFWLILMGV